MEYHESPCHETKDELLTLLADHHRRTVLDHLRESDDGVASLQELAAAVGEEAGDEDATLRLHHAALPRLEAAGVVDYDARSGTVRYRGNQYLETLVAFVVDL